MTTSRLAALSGKVKRLLPTRERMLDLLLSDPLWWVLPTPCAYLFNQARMREPMAMPDLPVDEWALAERRKLLADSQGRLASLEGKGPGLTTVTAVVVAGAVLAIASGWDESTALGRIVLVAAAVYTAFSLVTPLYLVGPLKHPTLYERRPRRRGERDQPQAGSR